MTGHDSRLSLSSPLLSSIRTSSLLPLHLFIPQIPNITTCFPHICSGALEGEDIEFTVGRDYETPEHVALSCDVKLQPLNLPLDRRISTSLFNNGERIAA